MGPGRGSRTSSGASLTRISRFRRVTGRGGPGERERDAGETVRTGVGPGAAVVRGADRVQIDSGLQEVTGGRVTDGVRRDPPWGERRHAGRTALDYITQCSPDHPQGRIDEKAVRLDQGGPQHSRPRLIPPENRAEACLRERVSPCDGGEKT